ncbi:MAG: Transcriptional regulator, AcrR-family [Eubacterium sp.]|jgi:AcrR family transcriptional regulator|nr:Transcriptional regulator, AcrR-family [Eubacterium sp.]
MKLDNFKESFRKISEEKRKAVLDSAVQEFSEYGFTSANINRIAENAGVSVGSIYKYFDNKEDMFLTIVHFAVDTLKTVLNEIIQSDETFEGRIEKIIKAIQSYSRTNVYLTKLYNEMTTESHSNLVWKIVSDMESTTAGMYISFIREAQEKGWVKKDLDPKLFAFFMDNLFVLLQFSYSCEYYKERLKIYVGEDVFDNDDLVAGQLMRFIKGAFLL